MHGFAYAVLIGGAIILAACTNEVGQPKDSCADAESTCDLVAEKQLGFDAAKTKNSKSKKQRNKETQQVEKNKNQDKNKLPKKTTSVTPVSSALKCANEEIPPVTGSWLNEPNAVSDETPVQLSVGHFHTCATLADGRFRCWGYRFSGQLGLSSHASSGKVRGWSLGDDEPVGSVEAVALDARVEKIAAGGYHTCARLDNGTVRCWGSNQKGQLGLGGKVTCNKRSLMQLGILHDIVGYSPVDLGDQAVALVSGHQHSCAALAAGGVRCWGSNSHGQLGIGALTPAESVHPVKVLGLRKKVVALSAGRRHTCALTKEEGRVLCWGNNEYAQLGIGDRGDEYEYDRDSFALVKKQNFPFPQKLTPVLRKDWRNDLLHEKQKSGRILSIDSGPNHTCATTDSGDPVCWGDNTFRQVNSNGDFLQTIPGWVVGLRDKVRSISGGSSLSCGILENSKMQCWGLHDEWPDLDSRYGYYLRTRKFDQSNGTAIERRTAFLSNSEAFSQYNGPVKSVSVGQYHACLLTDINGVYCWGRNTEGQLGLGVQDPFWVLHKELGLVKF